VYYSVHKSTKEMDVKTFAPGTEVRFLSLCTPNENAKWYDTCIISRSPDHRTYVVYIFSFGIFVEISRDAAKYQHQSSFIDRSEWMSIYVAALELGPEKLQKEVEAILRNSEDSIGRIYGVERDIAKIRSIYGRTLLYDAITRGQYKAAKLLLERGADQIYGNMDVYKNKKVSSRVAKLLLLYGMDGDHERELYGELPIVASILVHALCSSAPISKLPTNILRTYVLLVLP
jgi:hypothetical protein